MEKGKRERGWAIVPVWGRCVSVCLVALLLMTACNTIDDDLSDCGTEFEIVYELRLVTNIETEIQTQLTTQTEKRVGDALRGHLANIFTDFAHDIDLSFYDVSKDHDLLHHEEHVMDNNERSYTIYLPMREYRHLALANLQRNTWVKAEGRELSHTLNLMQEVRDTVASHETGLFTARTDMDVLADVDQTFYVKLYMANSAVALVLDPRGQDVRNVRVFTTGFATGFNVNDSTYTFAQRSPIVRTESIDTGTDLFCFCSVNFPSGKVSTRDVAEGDGACWKLNIYVTKADGTITETVLSVMEPLDAEQLKIIKAYLDEDGVAHPADATVGVSVTLDWNQGGEHDVEL